MSEKQYFASSLDGVKNLEPIPPSLFGISGVQLHKNLGMHLSPEDRKKCPWCNGSGKLQDDTE